MDHSQTMGRIQSHSKSDSTNSDHPYRDLIFSSGIHFIIMYAVMYTMVHTFDDVFLNLNNVYMTGMMLAPMTVMMLLTMKMMYTNRQLNMLIIASTATVFLAFYVFMRSQTFIGDKEFVRSMIPHHSGAILMCEEAKITDPELKSLCTDIVQGQREEIEQMRKILERL